jgi:hypothetical protein
MLKAVCSRRVISALGAYLLNMNMFDSFGEKRKSRLAKIILRALFSLAAGFILTFAVPMFMEAIWDYLKDSDLRPYPFAIFLANILNLPAVIICKFFPPEVAHKSDLSMVCWAYGFFLNIPYYALVIFISSWLIEGIILRRRQLP